MGRSRDLQLDESFIGVAGIRDLTRRAQALRERILRWTGLPCGVGTGSNIDFDAAPAATDLEEIRDAVAASASDFGPQA